MLDIGIVGSQLILFVTVQNLVFYLKVQPILLYVVSYLWKIVQNAKSWFICNPVAQVKQRSKNPNTIQHNIFLYYFLPTSTLSNYRVK